MEIFASISHDLYLYKLNYDVKQYRTPWPWIHSTSLRLESFFSSNCCRVKQCNDSCDTENVIGFVAKESESTAVESGFFWSQCWVGGSTFCIIYLTLLLEPQEGDNLQKMKTLIWVMGNAFVFASILGVLALIVDRFLAVYLHLRYQEIVTPKRVVSILILSWVISTIVSLFLIAQEYHGFLWIFMNVFLATCLTTIALLQCKIYSIVRRHRFQIRAQQVQGSIQTEDETRAIFECQKSSVRGAFYIYLLLLACYLPNILISFSYEMHGTNFQILYDYTLTLVFVNSCLNPLIYCWKLRHIRRTIRMILRNIFVRATVVQAAGEVESWKE